MCPRTASCQGAQLGFEARCVTLHLEKESRVPSADESHRLLLPVSEAPSLSSSAVFFRTPRRSPPQNWEYRGLVPRRPSLPLGLEVVLEVGSSLTLSSGPLCLALFTVHDLLQFWGSSPLWLTVRDSTALTPAPQDLMSGGG